MFYNKKRFCQHEWLKKYSWLDYDITSDSVTYYFYIYQNLVSWTIKKGNILRQMLW